MILLTPQPLTAEKFKPYGDVIDTANVAPIAINSGNCERFSDLAGIDIDHTGVAGISLFDAKPYTSPYQLNYVERHPLGSQAFMPMMFDPFLVVVADDENGVPQAPTAFLTNGRQGINFGRNVWHGVLTPIVTQSLFTVVDYIGKGDNLEEFSFNTPYTIEFQL